MVPVAGKAGNYVSVAVGYLRNILAPPEATSKLLQSVAAVHVLVASMSLLSATNVSAQTEVTPEEIQAAYLHKFAGFIDWPPKSFTSHSSPIVIGVVGSDRMYELLLGVVPGRPMQGRKVEVRRLTTPEQSSGVHMVFVGKEAWDGLPAWSAASRKDAVVVTTDAPQGVERGAALGFIQAGQRVRFEASIAAAEQSGVKFSSRLLAVAERVVQ
jgi:hypothetical protein